MHHINPSQSITGGSFYSRGVFDVELVKGLRQAILHLTETQASTASDIRDKIVAAQLCGSFLTLGDVERLLNSLVLENQLEKQVRKVAVKDARTQRFKVDTMYMKARLTSLDNLNIACTIPCTTCPLFNDCFPHGDISPSTCIYWDQWYSLDMNQNASTDENGMSW
jgi:hypothetical protein